MNKCLETLTLKMAVDFLTHMVLGLWSEVSDLNYSATQTTPPQPMDKDKTLLYSEIRVNQTISFVPTK